jgi:hypothetical protein
MSLANAVSSSGDAAAIMRSVMASVDKRQTIAEPYQHHLLQNLFPRAVADELAELPFQAPSLDGVSGKRELHNDTRSYFDQANMGRFPVMAEIAEALQAPAVTAHLAEAFDAPLDNTYLRLEYAQDVDGFWLEPHTDLGVKKFTCLIYLSEGPGHELLGTDIYASKTEHVGTSPFVRNTAMVFVPGSDTWHGFEKRPIAGVRKSVILNYVTPDWRAREQLSFPDQLIRL